MLCRARALRTALYRSFTFFHASPSREIGGSLTTRWPASRGFASTFHARAAQQSYDSPPPPSLEGLRPQNWDPRIKLAAFAVAGGSIYYVYHLEQVPITGRWRFMHVSPREEKHLAQETHQYLLDQYGGQLLQPDHFITLHVRRVVNRLLESSELGRLKDELSGLGTPGDTWYDEPTVEMPSAGPFGTPMQRDWNLLVVNDDKTINAMASNGTIVVFTGILPLCHDEDGLAAVIGHEIAHVVARHTAERLSSVTVFKSIAFLIDFLLQMDVGAIITTLALQLPNSRTQELEADRIGLNITAKACYNPQSAAEVQRRMGQMEKSLSRKLRIGFLETHPQSQTRVQILESLLPEAYAVRTLSPSCAGMEDKLNAFEDTWSTVVPKN